MSDKKYQVFVSSTFADLKDERRKTLDILLKADCIPAGMEAFVATDNEQFEVIKKVIDLCDYYILIIGKKYGSINPSTGISYTEMEYDYAISKNIPILVFAIDNSIVLPDEKEEQNEKLREDLNKFRNKAMRNRLASTWKTTDDLIGVLAIAIMSAKHEITRPGWQRATDYDEAELRREIMELQKQNNNLTNELSDAKNIISIFTEQPDIAFDGCDIEIAYSYYIKDPYRKMNDCVKIKLPVLFSHIATEMMDVSITEVTIHNVVKAIIPFPKSSDYGNIEDEQVVKRILNQFKALNLINSYWSKEKSALFWCLTEKGRKTRDDMILIRNSKECNVNQSYGIIVENNYKIT